MSQDSIGMICSVIFSTPFAAYLSPKIFKESIPFTGGGRLLSLLGTELAWKHLAERIKKTLAVPFPVPITGRSGSLQAANQKPSPRVQAVQGPRVTTLRGESQGSC